MDMNKIRHKVNDLCAEFWTDTKLWDFWEANDSSEDGVIAECMEDLAAKPEKARKWGGKVKYTHYDFTQIAKYHRLLQAYNALV